MALTVRVAGERTEDPVGDSDPGALARVVERMRSRTPEEAAAARRQTWNTLKPRTVAPPGMAAMELVYGQWPGCETDQEVAEALEQLS